MIALRDRPDPPGRSCIVKCTLVASTMSSRRLYFFSARPTISSELPKPVDVGGVPKVTPSSTACWKNGWASSYPSDHSLNPRDVSPKLMQPSAIRLTRRPELPRRLYSMLIPFFSCARPSAVPDLRLSVLWSRNRTRSRLARLVGRFDGRGFVGLVEGCGPAGEEVERILGGGTEIGGVDHE